MRLWAPKHQESHEQPQTLTLNPLRLHDEHNMNEQGSPNVLACGPSSGDSRMGFRVR